MKKRNKLQSKKMSKFKLVKYLILFIIIFISIFFSFSIIYFIKKDTIKVKIIQLFQHKPSKSDIYFEEKFPSLKESFDKAKNFLDKCLKGIIISNQTFTVSEKPKVSAIVTIHNCQNIISRAIKSIQNQDMTNIEIILVNDFSNDKTLSIIEEVAKSDPRIKIINNKKNMGTFYCRSIGVLSSKGKYIFHLDNDDMFLDGDVFTTVTNIADKGDFDMVNFRAVFAHHSSNLLTTWIMENYCSNHTSNLVMFQPEMGFYPFKPGKVYGKYDATDVYIWLKCVKTSV